MLLITLDVPERWQSRARHAFSELAARWRIPVRIADDRRSAHACYAADASSCPRSAEFLCFDPALYEPGTSCRPMHATQVGWIWCRSDLQDPDAADLVGGVHRLLCFLDESHVAEDHRDSRGIFHTDDLTEGRRRVLDEPLVERHAELLWQRLVHRHPSLERARLPRWPGARRFAIAASHDVDATRLGAPGELIANLAQAVLGRDLKRMELVALGVRHRGAAATDPYFAFSTWQEWESQRGLRSAFYVFHRPDGTPRHVNDCKSGLADAGTDWELLRRLADAGWEFGLHPSIHSKDVPGAFAASKAWIESRLERPVHGLRHHDWALDWREPHETLRLHQQAGFAYDSSIGWRERAGFRAGTALPFTPFDPKADRPLELLEIPCVLMDGHVLLSGARGTRTDPQEALTMGRSIIERVRDGGGVLTTNWHQETAFDRAHLHGYLDTLNELLAPFLGSSEAWLATPYQVCQHWKKLAAQLAIPAQ